MQAPPLQENSPVHLLSMHGNIKRCGTCMLCLGCTRLREIATRGHMSFNSDCLKSGDQ